MQKLIIKTDFLVAWGFSSEVPHNFSGPSEHLTDFITWTMYVHILYIYYIYIYIYYITTQIQPMSTSSHYWMQFMKQRWLSDWLIGETFTKVFLGKGTKEALAK